MHMGDALLSPIVGGVFWAASAGLIGYGAKKIAAENDIAKTPLMGVMGAFIFAAQMINFAIPGTGSSGHLGGGLLLTVVLGPWRAFITLASVLVIQCLFFADGGLLALGCNIFNLAFFPAFIAYPFIFKKIAGNGRQPSCLAFGAICAAVAGLELGAFSVVIQTVLSGNSDLPFNMFMLFMLPIHLAIGLIEGVVTWAVLAFVERVQPSLITGEPVGKVARPLTVIVTIAALVTGGALSYLASEQPDGLEWSIEKAAGNDAGAAPKSTIASVLAAIQKKIAFLPDYGLKVREKQPADSTKFSFHSLGTSLSGIIGSLVVLLLALALGIAFRKKSASDGKRS